MLRNNKSLTLSALVVTLFTSLMIAPSEIVAAGEIYSFTNAGATGNTGPTQVQVNSAYGSSALSGRVTINTQGIQEWTVPITGDYSVAAAGAAGGSNLFGNFVGGGGAVLTSIISLSQGTVLKIVVGQKGGDNPANCSTSYCGAAGGGGTFVYESSTSTYLIVAGGGGGGASTSGNLLTTKTQADGKATSTSGTSITTGSPCAAYTAAGGTGGSGGGASSRGTTNMAGPGGGINSAGGAAGGAEGKSLAGGWLGGLMSKSPALPGGFGGGGGSGSWSSGNYSWAGGGGGYSGGGGGFNAGCGDGQYGGGGGSFYTGTLVSSSNGSNSGHGYVTFTLLSEPVVSISIAAQATFRTASAITLTSDTAGRITVSANGKKIVNCIKVTLTGSSSSYSATCSWKPSTRGRIVLKASYYSSGSNQVSVTSSTTTNVVNRKTMR